MTSVQHPGSNIHEAAGGAPAPQAESKACKQGNVAIEFDQIQGNIFGGFNKDHQMNLLFQIDDAEKAKATLGPEDENDPGFVTGIFNHVQHSSSQQVLAFNEQFRALRRANEPEGSILATWTNLVFTAAGMEKLGVHASKFPEAFTQGMAARADQIGDIDAGGVTNAPAHWNDGMSDIVTWENVDGMLLVASDDPKQLDENVPGSRLANYLAKLKADGAGITLLGMIRGETRMDMGEKQVGHEHFGFKDGVSQPGVRGVDAPDDPLHNPNQGNPGQDLLHPGEFVLGYPTQIPEAPPLDDFDGPNPCQGPDSGEELPGWAKNGSFLVFRRLAQDVKGFREAVVKSATDLGIPPDLMGAKLVGRYASGAPLEPLKFQANVGEYVVPMTDPGVGNPALANSNALNNAFEYDGDDDGDIVPLAAHVRKAYPRDQEPEIEGRHKDGAPRKVGKLAPNEAESRTQTHRLLRRGIPFGKSFGAPEGGGENDPRGLLFFCYQSDLKRQFEFVQKTWVNDKDFPKADAGQDPVITNNSAAGAISGCPFHAKANASKCPVSFQHFVKTRGGGYFFSPSIKTLGKWLA